MDSTWETGAPLGAVDIVKCYTHPDNASVAPIIYNRDHGGDKEIRRELSCYAHLSTLPDGLGAIPNYYGTVGNRLRHQAMSAT